MMTPREREMTMRELTGGAPIEPHDTVSPDGTTGTEPVAALDDELIENHGTPVIDLYECPVGSTTCGPVP